MTDKTPQHLQDHVNRNEAEQVNKTPSTDAQSEAELLAQLRDRIDGIDQKIGDLISDRAQCALDVAKIKAQFSDQALKTVLLS